MQPYLLVCPAEYDRYDDLDHYLDERDHKHPVVELVAELELVVDVA